jgi:hypothetical protein
MEKAKKEFKGKKFIVDGTGKPILLAPVKAETLPPYSIPLGLQISNDARDNNQKGPISKLCFKKLIFYIFFYLLH